MAGKPPKKKVLGTSNNPHKGRPKSGKNLADNIEAPKLPNTDPITESLKNVTEAVVNAMNDGMVTPSEIDGILDAKLEAAIDQNAKDKEGGATWSEKMKEQADAAELDPGAWDEHQQRYEDKAKFEQYKADFEKGMELGISTWEATRLREEQEAQEAAAREAAKQEKSRVENALFGEGEEGDASNQGPTDMRLPEPEGSYKRQGPMQEKDLPAPETPTTPKPKEAPSSENGTQQIVEAITGLAEILGDIRTALEDIKEGEGESHG